MISYAIHGTPAIADVPSRLNPVFIPEDAASVMMLYKVEPEYPRIA
jgi:hypothetical protein